MSSVSARRQPIASQIELTALTHAAEGLGGYGGAMSGGCQATEAFHILKAHEDSFLPFSMRAISSDVIA